MDGAKRKRRRGFTRLSSKRQVTIPLSVLAATELAPGDALEVGLDEVGRIVLSPVESVADRRRAAIDATAGSLTGLYEPGELDRLRDEWR